MDLSKEASVTKLLGEKGYGRKMFKEIRVEDIGETPVREYQTEDGDSTSPSSSQKTGRQREHEDTPKLHYYLLGIPEASNKELQRTTQSEGTSVPELIRKSCQLGFVCTDLMGPGATISIEQYGLPNTRKLFML